MNKKECCLTCKFYIDNTCKRMPPKYVGSYEKPLNHMEYTPIKIFLHPEVPSDSWCGEYMKKEYTDNRFKTDCKYIVLGDSLNVWGQCHFSKPPNMMLENCDGCENYKSQARLE